MVVNRKVTGKAISVPAGVAAGATVSLCISVGGALIVAWMVGAEMMGAEGVGYAAMVILLVSSLLGPWLAATLIKHQRLMICMVTGCVFLVVLVGVNVLFFGGQFQGLLPSVLLILGGSVASALIGTGRGVNRTSVRRKHRYG